MDVLEVSWIGLLVAQGAVLGAAWGMWRTARLHLKMTRDLIRIAELQLHLVECLNPGRKEPTEH